jgi:hypothetical protein
MIIAMPASINYKNKVQTEFAGKKIEGVYG